MSRPSETWVLCGGASHPDAPPEAVRVSIGSGDGSMSVDIAGISRKLTGQVTPEFTDLIRIAAYVLGGDGAVSRGRLDDTDLGEKWHRQFRFVVPVESLAFWSRPETSLALEETLGFLSDDTYTFEFRQLAPKKKGRSGEQLTFSRQDGKPFLPWEHIEEISLFSGGLDSFAGAADLVLGQKRNVILVSHRSAPKMWNTQHTLVDDLRSIAQAHGCRSPEHVAIEVVKHDPLFRTERTQRSRSFLYTAIAGAVAQLVGRDTVRVYENGIVGINLPIAGSVVGARATRTAHPRVLHGFAKILSQVAGRPFKVENAFALKTRTEIIEHISSLPAIDLAKRTMSCAHIHRRSTMHPHCGVCSQCIDRQFGFLGARMEQHDSPLGYELKLETGEWAQENHRSLLLNWIAAADKFAACKNAEHFLQQFGDAARAVPALMEAFGLDADGAARSVYELHRRHGETVGRVLSDLNARFARQLREGTLKSNALPMLLVRQGLERSGTQLPAPTRSVAPLREYLCRRDGDAWTLRFRGGQPFALLPNRGLALIHALLERPGEVVTPGALEALHNGCDPAPDSGTTVDAETMGALQERLTRLRADRTEADECCDIQAVERLDEEIEELEAIVRRFTAVATVRQPGREEKKLRDAVVRDIEATLTDIRGHSAPLADHLEKNLKTGFLLWYRDTGIQWDLGVLPGAEASALPRVPVPTVQPDGPVLVVDLRRPFVEYRGHEVRTQPPNHLQHHSLLALAALAEKAGETLTMVEIADRMWKLGGLQKRPTSPVQKDLRYRIIEPFRAALNGVLADGEIDELLTSSRSLGLRLNIDRNRVKLVLREDGSAAASEQVS